MNNYKGYTIEKGVVKDPRGRVNTADKNGMYHLPPFEQYTLEDLMKLCGVSSTKASAKVSDKPEKVVVLDETEKEMLKEFEEIAHVPHVDKKEKKHKH